MIELNADSIDVIRLSKKKVRRPCKSTEHQPNWAMGFHSEEIYSDGWTKLVCIRCGRVSYQLIMKTEAK